MTTFSRKRSLDDPSYEPNRLYEDFGRPNLGTWLLLTIAAYVGVSVVFVWCFVVLA